MAMVLGFRVWLSVSGAVGGTVAFGASFLTARGEGGGGAYHKDPSCLSETLFVLGGWNKNLRCLGKGSDVPLRLRGIGTDACRTRPGFWVRGLVI